MKRFLEGYKAFRKEFNERQDLQQLFSKLADGQSPEILLLTCSDSRIDPTLITKSKPGDLFTIRNAGNIVPAPHSENAHGELGTMQFAVDVLKVSHIIVCGHSDCGAVKGLRNIDSLRTLPYLHSWLCSCEDIQYAAESSLEDSIKTHCLKQLENLCGLDFIQKALKESRVELHAWYLDVGHGKIETYVSNEGQWVELDEEPIVSAITFKTADSAS